MNPTFDGNGYPTEETLQAIAQWDGDWRDWLLFCAKAWHHTGKTIFGIDSSWVFITGGWSGNEEVIAAMRSSAGWSLTWQSSHRGGKHVFSVSDLEGQRMTQAGRGRG